jgi:hypothetical protein
MMAGNGGYISCNHLASSSAEYNVFNKDTAKTIAGTINSHIANLSAQRAASLETNKALH